MISYKELKKQLNQDVSSFPVLKVALLGDSATQFLATALKSVSIMRGYSLDLFEADYNQVERQCMDPASEFHSFGADYVVIFQSTHKLLSLYNKLPLEKQIGLANERIEFVQFLCSAYSGRIIYANYPELDDTVFGSFANKIERSFTYQIRKLNYELMRFSGCNSNFFVLDLAALQNKFGRDMFFDASIYVHSEMVLSVDSIPYVAFRIMDIICALRGKFKKCLILDLDNTLWGGVIGDDGIENIQLGHGLGIGKVFTEFQHWLKKLKNRGIILTVCSKNNIDTAREPFLKHPDMVLKLEDIAVFMANWENKADNIRQIQAILNIDFDSMVFLDDNPAERAVVRENIPDITVPELPEDPADYLEYLYGLNLFETASYSDIDNERTKQYQVETQRVLLQKTFTNEVDFLKSLDMVSEIKDFDSFNIPRVAQLSQRSNQFNLRTIRYTETDIEKIAKDANYTNFSFTLSDKFGDNGLICVIILKKQDAETLFIDTWFMSCRVLKRGMEHFTLNSIMKYAQEHGFKRIIGEYIETAKNALVRNHYPDLGFSSLVNNESRMLFVLNCDEYNEKLCFIKSKEQYC